MPARSFPIAKCLKCIFLVLLATLLTGKATATHSLQISKEFDSFVAGIGSVQGSQVGVEPARVAPADTVYPRSYQVFTKTDQPASFPGGESEMRKLIRANLKYPPNALRNGVNGMVLVQFVVDRNGKIVDPKVVNPLGYGTDEEVLRVVSLFPSFVPAVVENQPVEFRFTVPFRFGIQDSPKPRAKQPR